MAKTEVAKKSSTEMVAGAMNYGEMAGVGFEDTKSSDLSIPFFNLLQSNSPQVEEGQIEGAKPGLIYNTVTGELISTLPFIPVHKEEKWVEWIPRTKGGGFVAAHEPGSDLVKALIAANGGGRIPPKGEDGKRISFKHNGNDVIETYYVYGLSLNEDGSEVESFGVLSFSSTKIKPYRDWLTSMYLIKGKPPMFANRAKISTIRQTNDSGNFYNFRINPLRDTWVTSLIHPEQEASLLQQAVEFREMVLSGVARADLTQQDSVVTAGAGGDGEAPF